MKHWRFISRTILVENNQIDVALKGLQKLVSQEKIPETARRWQSYEKPYQRRNRLSFEKCMEIYNQEMERKIKFIVHKNRENPYPWH